MDKLDLLYQKMIAYYTGDPARIQHFVKVHSFARLIGRTEGLSDAQMEILEAAAYVHDIGIKLALVRYGSSAGRYQEELGPDLAAQMLRECGFSDAVIERVCYLVGHHHTYVGIDGADYHILVEADFLVNLYEDQSDSAAIESAYRQIFRTTAGRTIFLAMYPA